MITRLVHFASSTVAIEYYGQRSTRLVQFLLADIPHSSPESSEKECVEQIRPPHFTYRLLEDGDSGSLCLYAGEELERNTHSEAEMAVHLIGRLCYQLAYHSHAGLVLHAACLSRDGKGVLLPGPTGSGKTTLAAWLLTRGFDYLTDELVFIPEGAQQVQALTRPLNLKVAARPLLKDVFRVPEGTSEVLSSSSVDLVPPSLLRPAETHNQVSLDVILFPHFRPGCDLELRKLSKAQAGLALMECLINARNLHEHGFPEVIRLVKSTPTYEMNYADFEPVDAAIETPLSPKS